MSLFCVLRRVTERGGCLQTLPQSLWADCSLVVSLACSVNARISWKRTIRPRYLNDRFEFNVTVQNPSCEVLCASFGNALCDTQ